MADAHLNNGDSLQLGGVADVYGLAGTQSLEVLDNSTITFRSGWNAGNTDAVRVDGSASNFKIVTNGPGNVVLVSTVDNITLNIPVGTNGINLTFDGGDTRTLTLVGNNVVVSGTNVANYTATSTPTFLQAGPATFSITGAATATEGSDYSFVAHRTTDGVNAALTLTFNVIGDTNGNTVPAATSGLDFNTAAGNTVTFAAGSLDSAPFLVHLNTDNLVEGLEGIKVQLFNGAVPLTSTTGLIADANHVGQTFTLTGGVDTVGSGTALDLVGSEGSTSVVGQDNIVVTENTANTFDNVNGGPDKDMMTVLDAGTFFTTAPNFANITVTNVEGLNYTSVRGLFNNAINTTAWTGLQTENFQLVSGVTQTVTSATTLTSESITNAGAGGVTVQGGGGALAVNVGGAGTINVGQDLANNAFTSIATNGGGTVNILDNGTQELATVSLNGFSGNANVTGSAITTVGITNITAGGTHTATINGNSNPTVTVTNSSGGALNLTTDGSATFVIGANVTDLNDVRSVNGNGATLTFTGNTTLFFDDFSVDDGSTAGPTPPVTINNNSSNGSGIVFDDINGDSTTNDTRLVNLHATNGAITLDDIFMSALNATPVINIDGSSRVTFDAISSFNGAQINVTGSGGVTANTTALAATATFNGAGDTGSDLIAFGATSTANTLGGGNDTAFLTAGTFSGGPPVTGSVDGGAGADIVNISEANAQSLTAQGNFLSNFEQSVLTGGNAAGVTTTVNTANLGFSANTTNIVVTGANSGTSTQEVTTVTFTGTSTGMVQGSSATVSTGDKVGFDGFNIQFDDNATGAELSKEFKARYDSAVGTHHYSVVDNLNGSVTITNLAGGTAADLTAASFDFSGIAPAGHDTQNIGAPSDTVNNYVQGVTAVTAVKEVAILTLNNVAVANGETITITNGTNTFTYTNTSGGTLLGSNGGANPAINNALATDFVNKFNTDNSSPLYDATIPGAGAFPGPNTYTASVSNGNIIFTADQANSKPNLTLSGPGTTGLTTPADDFSMAVTTQGVDAVTGSKESFDLTITGAGNANDTIVYDGGTGTITLNGTENTNEAVAQRFAGAVTANWTVTSVTGNVVHFVNNNNGNVTDVTSGFFVITDDTNVGTPAIGTVTVNTQGDVGGLVLNNVTNNALVELQGDGIYSVNLATTTAADVLNLTLTGGRTVTVNAPSEETVNINTDNDIFTNTDTLTLNDTSATTLVIAGNDNLTLTTNSTAITSVNETGNSGLFTWTSGALANAVSVSTGSGGSNINLLAATKAVTFTGGSGNDVLVLNNANNTTVNLGAGNDTVTTGTGLTNSVTVGAGHDIVNVTQTLNGNSYSKVADYTAASISAVGGSGDTIHFVGSTDTFNATQVPTLQPTASFQDYLDAAAAGGPGTIRWFQFTSGVGADNNTYIVDDHSGATTFQNGVDNVIQLTGLINLAGSTSAGGSGSVFIA